MLHLATPNFWVHVVMILSYKCVIPQRSTVIRFFNDNASETISENDKTRAVDTAADARRSTMPIWWSNIALCLYQWLYLGLMLSVFLAYGKFIGRVPDVIRIPTYYILLFAFYFSYTYRVFDLRTNLMIIAVIALRVTPNALRRGSPINQGHDMVSLLMINLLFRSYSYHCWTPLEPNSAIYGFYAPPVSSSQTGTGSDLEVDEVQEAHFIEKNKKIKAE